MGHGRKRFVVVFRHGVAAAFAEIRQETVAHVPVLNNLAREDRKVGRGIVAPPRRELLLESLRPVHAAAFPAVRVQVFQRRPRQGADGVEAMGCGTLAYDEENGKVLPHIHTTLGEKARSATAHTSHLLSARVQFLVEMLIVEVTSPIMSRPSNPALYDVPTLTFGV